MAAALGGALVCAGAILIVGHRPTGVLLVRSQPRWMHPWRRAAQGSSTIILVIGIGLVVSGVLEIVLGW